MGLPGADREMFCRSAIRPAGWRGLTLLNGYIRYLRQKKSGEHLQLRETSLSYGSKNELDSLDEPPGVTM